MQTITKLDLLRKAVGELRADGATIALVPTMGALHEGHLTLIREAKKRADYVVASVFVNPAQFGKGEDLEAYPRQLAEDSAALDGEGTALLWAPDTREMYPDGFATNIVVAGVSAEFCGASRPGHFDGVALVVCKLFNQVQPDIAIFGEKDWQQLAVIRRMAADLDLRLPSVTRIVGIPTVRESDGLAMSSRNRYLSKDDRAAAATLPREMREAIARIEDGQSTACALGGLEDALLGAGFNSVDYAELADAATLEKLEKLGKQPARLLVAARIGGTRLIDNMAVGGAG
ncbi:pantoate--beta-alanine ligase [Altererythrobacter aquiaggeris]|uniref:pantoate--beta-alanine ligase n=1 Tax=Aestuarierythrobacter aquiaggeris TaxID=1898396 RepID=UPI0030173357